MNSKTTEQAAEETNYDVLKHAYEVLQGYCEWQKQQRAEQKSTITTLQAEVDRLRALVPVWVDIKANPAYLNSIDQDRTLILFDNGQILFYGRNWPFAEAIGAFEIPSPPINQEK